MFTWSLSMVKARVTFSLSLLERRFDMVDERPTAIREVATLSLKWDTVETRYKEIFYSKTPDTNYVFISQLSFYTEFWL